MDTIRSIARFSSCLMLFVCLSLLASCAYIEQPIYLKCDLVPGDVPESTRRLAPWVSNARLFTGKLPTRLTKEGVFAGLDAHIAQANDLKLSGTMTYADVFVPQEDGSLLHEPDNPTILSYRFTFDRLSNELVITYDEVLEPKTTAVRMLRFACERATP